MDRVACLAALLTLVSCRGTPPTSPPFSFPTTCPDPLWLDESAPTGSSHSELQALFLKLNTLDANPQRLPSVGFLSMKRYPDRPEVVLYSLMLVAHRGDWSALEACADHFIRRDLNYRSGLGDPTYHVAGAVGQVGQALLQDGNAEGAVRLFDALYSQRGAELPAHVAQGQLFYYALALEKTGHEERAVALLKDLIARGETTETRRLRGELQSLQSGVPKAQAPLPNVPHHSIPTPDSDSPAGSRIIALKVADETPQVLRLDVEYDFREAKPVANFRMECVFQGGESDGHFGFQPGLLASGHGVSRVNLTAASGPDRLVSERLRCSIYEVMGGTLCERTFPYHKVWLRRP
jgi:hypothetical protein